MQAINTGGTRLYAAVIERQFLRAGLQVKMPAFCLD
jgi:hypothetical protein